MTVELTVLSCQLLNFKAKADQKHLPSKNVILNQGWNNGLWMDGMDVIDGWME